MSKAQRASARKVYERGQKQPLDLDPEELITYDAPSSGAETDSEAEQEDQARSHYADLGKSKLRKAEDATLGPRYMGSRVAREGAFDDDSDDPFDRGFEENGESEDEPLSVKAAPRHNGRISSSITSEDEGSIAEDLGDSEDSDSDSSGGVHITEDEDEDDSDVPGVDDDYTGGLSKTRRDHDVDRAELRRIMAEDQKNVSATLSQAAQADVAKGKAVKAQRKAFDQLLNVRVRLQKTLIASNSLVTEQSPQHETSDDVVVNAEAAALDLWNSLNELRTQLQGERAGEKRKHSVFAADATAQSMWTQMQSLESRELPHRQNVLNKWSAKARGATVALASARGRLSRNTAEQSLTDVLNAQLLEQDRLIQRTRTPRSCAPVQANAGITESRSIYDDADFYGLLLKELLEQRNAQASTAALDFGLQPWQAAREAKTKKVVDTKASKGRKLRYTVHEKLQNFMAPEDRTTWRQRQVDELFGGLFGRKAQLGEDVDGPGSDVEDIEQEEAGLMLFRS